MIFNQTEFGHIAVAMQWSVRLRFFRQLLYFAKNVATGTDPRGSLWRPRVES